MDAPVLKSPVAWQPLTPHGVAAFAFATVGRLLLVQFIFAAGAAAAVVWFLHTAWFPVVGSAIRQLPEAGEIRSGKLQWQPENPTALADNRFLALMVDLDHRGEARSPAHLQVEFGSGDLRIFSLFGFFQTAYPRTWVIAFNRAELLPWWGAWSPEILALVASTVVGGLLLIWWAMAAAYATPLWIAAFFANRGLTLAGAWRMSGAALMPGALFQTGALFLYGLGGLDLIKLMAAFAIHFVIPWGYLVAAVICLPRLPGVVPAGTNPFHPSSPPVSTAGNHPEIGPPEAGPPETPVN